MKLLDKTGGKPIDLKEAKAMMNDYLKSSKNSNLKLGEIKDIDRAFEAEIRTRNNALVDRVLIDKATGYIGSAYLEQDRSPGWPSTLSQGGNVILEAEPNRCLRDKKEGKHLEKEDMHDPLRFHQGVGYPL